jgi:hypothetical protein
MDPVRRDSNIHTLEDYRRTVNEQWKILDEKDIEIKEKDIEIKDKGERITTLETLRKREAKAAADALADQSNQQRLDDTVGYDRIARRQDNTGREVRVSTGITICSVIATIASIVANIIQAVKPSC